MSAIHQSPGAEQINLAGCPFNAHGPLGGTAISFGEQNTGSGTVVGTLFIVTRAKQEVTRAGTGNTRD